MSSTCITQTTSTITPIVVKQTEEEVVAAKNSAITDAWASLDTSVGAVNPFANFGGVQDTSFNPFAASDVGEDPFPGFGGGVNVFNMWGRRL